MKKIFLYLIINCLTVAVFGQSTDGMFDFTSCYTAKRACANRDEGGMIYAYTTDLQVCEDSLTTQYISIQMTGPGVINLYPEAHTGNYVLYGPMSTDGDYACQLIDNGQAIIQATGSLSDGTVDVQAAGYYIFKINTSYIPMTGGCGINLGVYSREETCDEEIGCEDCISSFSPAPGKYIVSGWVKGDASNINSGYSNPKIKVSFAGASNNYTLTTVGNVIDGWQQMRGEITVPTSATDIYIKFSCASGNCYFDDVRFLPKDASMKSFVYDPRTRKMMATLDGRNYGTFYEYDEEGKLIRVKKETERGIMTIKENRNHIQINQ